MTNINEIFNPVKVFAGRGAIDKLPAILDKRRYAILSSNVFLRMNWQRFFPHAQIQVTSVKSNPTVDDLLKHLKEFSSFEGDTIVAIGGGSVIDVAKVLSVVKTNNKNVLLEYLQNSKKVEKKNYDLIAIPTTAGTGSEVTPFATIWDETSKKKYSINSPLIFPQIAIVDSDLMSSLDFSLTAITGLDALSHAFESLWNKNWTVYNKALALEAINNILDHLPPLLDDLTNAQHREKISYASLLAGLCISHTKTAIAHSISYPLTLHLNAPHGLAAGAFLPQIFELNLKKDSNDHMQSILTELSGANRLAARLDRLYQKLDAKNLFALLHENREKVFALIPEMFDPNRALNNLTALSLDDIELILSNFFY